MDEKSQNSDKNPKKAAMFLGMIISGLPTMLFGLALVRILMENSGKIQMYFASAGFDSSIGMGFIMFATFSPLLLAGLVGWSAAAGGGRAKPIERAFMAMVLTLPIALLDPWAIVSLGVGAQVSLALKLAFLASPLLIAAVFAYSGWSHEGFRPIQPFRNIVVLMLVTGSIYFIIYWVILPWGNPTANPLVPL